MMAADLEAGEVKVPVHGVAGEEAAEEHDFGGEKNPHAEPSGFVLLFEVFELVRESARGVTFGQRKISFAVSTYSP
jgi:hypothetical protein